MLPYAVPFSMAHAFINACAANCHGRQGKGDNNEYMESIGHKPADHTDVAAMQRLSDTELFLALRDGVKDKRGWLTMPPWASVLTPTEMWDVITYVRRLPFAEITSQRHAGDTALRSGGKIALCGFRRAGQYGILCIERTLQAARGRRSGSGRAQLNVLAKSGIP